MNRFVKGMIIGGLIGVGIGLFDYSCMPNMAKKYMKKGKKILRQMM